MATSSESTARSIEIHCGRLYVINTCAKILDACNGTRREDPIVAAASPPISVLLGEVFLCPMEKIN
jgi:hypothetical protein